jgi:hypothetical protein
MSTKDHTNFYDGVSGLVPNTVSRDVKVGDRSFLTTVTQSFKGVLDSEYQLIQDADQFAKGLTNRYQAPSGWLRGQTHYDGYDDYGTITPPAGFVDSTGTHLNHGTMIDSFLLPRLVAQVAGNPVVVEYTNTTTPEYNLVTLDAPTIYDGTPLTIKRTDFVFLEVWKALVAPSVASRGSVTVVAFGDISAGDLITLGGHNLTAVVGVPAADEFQIGGTNDATATNIAAAFNLSTNWWYVNNSIKAKAFGPVVQLYAIIPGAAGDAITVAVTLAAPGTQITVFGPNLTGGADRPYKPDQNHLYRHGNVLSPLATWLADDLIDPVVNQETTQRVQLQYRIRSTGTTEAINYKTHPDGFSTKSGGAATTLAWGGTGSNVATYPFVPANRTTVDLNSSAVALDVEDPGLWVAGNGTSAAAVALGSLDGFVYAIPICFVHRYNDASSAALKGFNPSTNTNGAPLYDHAGYAGAIGAIPAGLSDRPDDSFANVIVQDNLLDLRRHIIFPGIDTSAELQYQIQSLLDGSTRTWSVDAADKQMLGNGSGDVSTQFLVCNEIGRSVANGGIGDTTTRGDFVREFDHIARRFGDQAVVERFVMAFYPGDRAVGPVVAPGLINPGKFVTKAAGSGAARWHEDDILRLDMSLLDSTTVGSLFQGVTGGGTSAPAAIYVADVIPVGTVITDILSVRHDDGFAAGAAISQSVQVKNIVGLGTTCIDITLDSNPVVGDGGGIVPADSYPLADTGAGTDGSPRRIFVEVELTYPIGEGTTDTVYHPLTPDPVVYDFTAGVGPGPVVADPDSSQEPNDMEELIAPQFRDGYREVQLEYIVNDTWGHAIGDRHAGSAVGTVAGHEEYLVSTTNTTLYYPRRIWRDATQTSVYDTLAAANVNIDDTLTEWGSSSRKMVTLDALTAAQTLCKITYFPQDAIPNYGLRGYQLGVYFRTHAPQTAGVSDVALGSPDTVLPRTLRVEPLFIGPDVWTNQVGSGSQDRGFPYVAPMDQIPINDGIAPSTYEWFLCATSDVTIADFNADTGIIALRPFVQADGQNVLEFGGTAAAELPRKDMDFRAYYPFARDDLYRPTVLSQPLFGAVRHKVLFPFLARSLEEIPGTDGGILYRKNELLLIVISRFAALDAENNVRFTDPVASNRTCAALYRTRNMLIMVGDRSTMPSP